MSMIKGQDIVCISTSDWDRPWGSKQQLMLRLSTSNRVLYVEYQASFLHFCFLPFLFLRIKKPKNRLTKINENLFIFTPYPYLPFGYYFRAINKINQGIILRSLRKILKKIGFSNPILWIYPPCAIDLVGKLSEKLTLYHCLADFPNEKKNFLRSKTIFSMEKELVEKSDIVLTLTESLYEKYVDRNTNICLFPSAVDDNLFSSFLSVNADEPEDIANLKRPRIGLVGYLDGRILDIDLLCDIADERPEWSLVLIGPKFRYPYRLSPLAKRRNVYFLGEKKNAQIPMYIKSLDVCMIPYVTNEFTNNVSPLKLYEYLALGKPVVSTKIADLERFKGVIRVSGSKKDFIENISLCLEEKDIQLVNKRQDLAKENSWDERLQTVSQLIDKSLKERF